MDRAAAPPAVDCSAQQRTYTHFTLTYAGLDTSTHPFTYPYPPAIRHPTRPIRLIPYNQQGPPVYPAALQSTDPIDHSTHSQPHAHRTTHRQPTQQRTTAMPFELFKTFTGNEVMVAIVVAVFTTVVMIATGSSSKKVVVNPGAFFFLACVCVCFSAGLRPTHPSPVS